MNQDDYIKSEAEIALFSMMENADQGIKVDVEKGVVTISGIVDVLSEKSFAEKIIKSLNGVKGVNNSLTICTDGQIADNDINEELTQRLTVDKDLKNEPITSEVKHGIVYLRGHANTLEKSNKASTIAGSIIGVKEIINLLKIQSKSARHTDDATLTNATEAAFAGSKEVSADDIETQCKNGVVYLEGTVGSNKEKEDAAYWASSVPGVKKIINRLKHH